MAISDTTPASSVPLSSLDLTSKLTWIVAGSGVKKCGVTIKENYCPSLERLEVTLLCFSTFLKILKHNKIYSFTLGLTIDCYLYLH